MVMKMLRARAVRPRRPGPVARHAGGHGHGGEPASCSAPSAASARLAYRSAARIVVQSPGFKRRLVDRGVPAAEDRGHPQLVPRSRPTGSPRGGCADPEGSRPRRPVQRGVRRHDGAGPGAGIACSTPPRRRRGARAAGAVHLRRRRRRNATRWRRARRELALPNVTVSARRGPRRGGAAAGGSRRPARAPAGRPAVRGHDSLEDPGVPRGRPADPDGGSRRRRRARSGRRRGRVREPGESRGPRRRGVRPREPRRPRTSPRWARAAGLLRGAPLARRGRRAVRRRVFREASPAPHDAISYLSPMGQTGAGLRNRQRHRPRRWRRPSSRPSRSSCAATSGRRCSSARNARACAASPFTLHKFRTMTEAADRSGKLLADEQRLTRSDRSCGAGAWTNSRSSGTCSAAT